jgi:hypothetical protein
LVADFELFNGPCAYRDKKLSVSLCVFRAPASLEVQVLAFIISSFFSTWAAAAANSDESLMVRKRIRYLPFWRLHWKYSSNFTLPL